VWLLNAAQRKLRDRRARGEAAPDEPPRLAQGDGHQHPPLPGKRQRTNPKAWTVRSPHCMPLLLASNGTPEWSSVRRQPGTLLSGGQRAHVFNPALRRMSAARFLVVAKERARYLAGQHSDPSYCPGADPLPNGNPLSLVFHGRDLPRPRLAHTFSPSPAFGSPSDMYPARADLSPIPGTAPRPSSPPASFVRVRRSLGWNQMRQATVSFLNLVGHGSRNSVQRVWAWCGPMPRHAHLRWRRRPQRYRISCLFSRRRFFPGSRRPGERMQRRTTGAGWNFTDYLSEAPCSSKAMPPGRSQSLLPQVVKFAGS